MIVTELVCLVFMVFVWRRLADSGKHVDTRTIYIIIGILQYR